MCLHTCLHAHGVESEHASLPKMALRLFLFCSLMDGGSYLLAVRYVQGRISGSDQTLQPLLYDCFEGRFKHRCSSHLRAAFNSSD